MAAEGEGMSDRFGDFTGITEIKLPVSLAPRTGKYYGTEIVDARGALVIDLWEHGDDAVPSDREKEYFGSEWSEEAWSEYCCDSHWECQDDYLFAVFLVKALNLAMEPAYAGLEGHLKYAVNRFSVSRSSINEPEAEFKTWLQYREPRL
jgi:hypothetical protein